MSLKMPSRKALLGLAALSSLTTPGEGLPGGYGTLRRMQRDPQVRACLSRKKFAVLSHGWEVHAATDAPEDQAVGKFVRACFNGTR